VCEAAKVLSMSVSHRGGVYIPRNLMIYSSSSRVIIVKYSRLWWNENVARMEETRNTYVPNFDEKNLLENAHLGDREGERRRGT
jgi:hypothetical protein